ncbi:bcl2-associated agonist of cell death-like isoform X2 [Xenopus laevis]|nr:bcl2-associated agonist of cell death-like isoform X2 [Xenopus laevis]XP_041416703.1 bcl2-associated agonist of cell death-like isoform X2 [Xenopus laevis]XP_041416704.1 bcl2-associated agonist of cell death-like isoform X2 [Xenopus laevis]
MADSSPSAVFKLEEFKNEEQGVPFSFVDPARGAGFEQPVAKSSPNLRRHPGKEPRLRIESATDHSETDKVSELHPFRSRSRSAPSSMIATKYGRELRRMSDEFEKSFAGLPRPKSAGAAGQMTGNKSFKELIMGLFVRRKSKGKDESGDEE